MSDISEFREENHGIQDQTLIPDIFLHMEYLYLENFKSYGGKHTIGPFCDKLTAIIGPNGCGKSNIIDAMLFVFGRKTMMLRQKKLIDLIHISPKIPDAKRACVTVHFREYQRQAHDNNLSQFSAGSKGKPFVVSRVIHADGRSKLYINGELSTSHQLKILLLERHIDLAYNRFLILQGEVEQIAMMNPRTQSPGEEGLLEYLENIIGSNAYIDDIRKARDTLSSLTDLMTEKKKMLQAIRSTTASLEGPFNIAKHVCFTEKRIIDLKLFLEVKTVKRFESNMKLLKSRCNESQEILKESATWQVKEGKEYATLEKTLGKKKSIVLNTEMLISNLAKKFNSLEQLDDELTAKLSHVAKRILTNKAALQDYLKESNTCLADSASMHQKAEVLKSQIPLLKERIERAQSDLNTLDGTFDCEFRILRARKAEADNNLSKDRLQLLEVEASVKALQTGIDLYKTKKNELLDTMDAAQKHLEACTVEQESVKNKLDAVTKELNSAQKNALSIQEKTQKVLDEAQIVNKSIIRCQDKVYSQKKNHSKTVDHNLIDEIMRAKNRGLLPGVIDRLWGLGHVPDKVQTAVAAVAGQDFLVVQTPEDAQAVVEYVRLNSLGRVTCIVLSRVKKDMEHEYKQRKVQPLAPSDFYLVDMIQCESEDIKMAFFFILRDIILTKDLDRARSLAFASRNRQRVVTLDGQIVDRAGTLTGGAPPQLDASIFRRNLTAQCNDQRLRDDLQKAMEEVII